MAEKEEAPMLPLAELIPARAWSPLAAARATTSSMEQHLHALEAAEQLLIAVLQVLATRAHAAGKELSPPPRLDWSFASRYHSLGRLQRVLELPRNHFSTDADLEAATLELQRRDEAARRAIDECTDSQGFRDFDGLATQAVESKPGPKPVKNVSGVWQLVIAQRNLASHPTLPGDDSKPNKQFTRNSQFFDLFAPALLPVVEGLTRSYASLWRDHYSASVTMSQSIAHSMGDAPAGISTDLQQVGVSEWLVDRQTHEPFQLLLATEKVDEYLEGSPDIVLLGAVDGTQLEILTTTHPVTFEAWREYSRAEDRLGDGTSSLECRCGAKSCAGDVVVNVTLAQAMGYCRSTNGTLPTLQQLIAAKGRLVAPSSNFQEWCAPENAGKDAVAFDWISPARPVHPDASGRRAIRGFRVATQGRRRNLDSIRRGD